MGSSAPARCAPSAPDTSAPAPDITPSNHLPQDIEEYVNTLTSRLQDSKRTFVRIKFVRRAVISMALVDSGNLSKTLISEKLAKILGLKITPINVNLRSPDQQTIQVLGQTNISFYLEGVKKQFSQCAYVIKDLSFPVNLGRLFLGDARAHLDFLAETLSFGRGEGAVALLDKSSRLGAPSLDTRFTPTLQDALNLGIHESDFVLWIPARMRACPELRRPPQVGARTPLPEPESVQQMWGEEDPRPHFRSPSRMSAGGACTPAQEARGGQPVPEDAPAPCRAGGGEEPAYQPPPEEVPPLPPESSQTPHHSTPNCPTRVAPKPEKSVKYDVSTV